MENQRLQFYLIILLINNQITILYTKWKIQFKLKRSATQSKICNICKKKPIVRNQKKKKK